MSFVHARLFDTCWGLGLARIAIDEEFDVNKVVLTLWPPVADDGSEGEMILDIRCPAGGNLPDDKLNMWEEATRKMLADLTIEKFEDAFELAGFGKFLDRVCGLTN